jgi:hypothetical protein
MRNVTVVAVAAAVAAIAPAAALGSAGSLLSEAGRADGDALAAGVDSNTWADLNVHWLHRLDLAWPGGPVRLGASVELPVLLWARTGGLHAARLGAHLLWEPLRSGRLGLSVDAWVRLGLHRDAMGSFATADVLLRVFPALHFDRGDLGLVLGLQQGLATALFPSDYLSEAWRDRYDDGVAHAATGPKQGLIALPTRRFSLGLAGAIDLGARLRLTISAGLLLEPAAGLGLLDRMMVGVWPFFADAGLVWAW